MKGLLIKDFINLKGFGRISLLVIAGYAIFAMATGSIAFISTLLLVFCAMLPMTSTALDETAKWNAYVQCVPVTRGQVVLAKYLMMLITGLLALLFSLLVSLLTSLRFPIDWGEVLASNLMSICMVMLINAISLPAIYRFGVEKARIVIMVAFMLCLMLFMVTMGEDGIAIGTSSLPWLALPLVTLAALVGSYFLSRKIYSAKEF